MPFLKVHKVCSTEKRLMRLKELIFVFIKRKTLEKAPILTSLHFLNQL